MTPRRRTTEMLADLDRCLPINPTRKDIVAAYALVADAYRCTPGAVKQAANRARRRMRPCPTLQDASNEQSPAVVD